MQKTKKPSYLSEVKAALRDFFRTQTEDTTAQEELLAGAWKVVMPQVVQSYWNGVRDGATGKVKPKEKSARK